MHRIVRQLEQQVPALAHVEHVEAGGPRRGQHPQVGAARPRPILLRAHQVFGCPIHGGEEDSIRARLEHPGHERLQGGRDRFERRAHRGGVGPQVRAQLGRSGHHLAEDGERREHGLDQRHVLGQRAAEEPHRFELLAERPLVGRAGSDAGPVPRGMDGPGFERRLLAHAATIKVANAPGLDMIVLARIELDPVPVVLALELEGGIHQVRGGGLAVIEMPPEGDRRPVGPGLAGCRVPA